MEEPYINIHTHRPQPGTLNISAWMLGTGEVAPVPPYAAGLHPWSLTGMTDTEINAALEVLNTPPGPVVAVGEIGLDYTLSKEAEVRKRQQQIFAVQLEIAATHGLPVIVHCVHALDDALRILREHPVRAAIFHGFTGSPGQAAQAVDAGHWLSFGERTFRSPKTMEALRRTPPDRLFLETDDSSVPIEEIYAQSANILHITTSELKRQIAANYQTIFG